MEKNYKILQEAFNTCGIQKHVEVQKLVRAKYNLLFRQSHSGILFCRKTN